MSNARCAWPSQRMAWWMRPGPRRFWASTNPSPGLPMRFSFGHPHVVVDDLGVAAGLAGARGRARPSWARRAGCHAGRVGRHDDHRVAPGTAASSGFVTHMTMRKSATDAFEVNHLWPLMTHSSPSRIGPGDEQRRVGAGARARSSRSSERSFAVEQRLHPTLLLLSRAADGEQLGVARVGRVVAEDRPARRRSGRGSRASGRASPGRSRRRPARAGGGRPTGPGA